jgi:ankyrin repeat protein
VKLAHILLKHTTDTKAENKYGSTPLHMACAGGQAEIVFLLIEHGTDATA